MPAVPNWSAPTQFDLTNPYNTSMSFNVQTADGIYLLDQSQCSFDITVRSTTDNIPQADGYIPHHRFLTGVQMPLAIWLMETPESPACDELLVTMLDNVSGAFRSLLNAGDNEGRLAWEVAGQNERMLDDIRLLVYPTFEMDTKGVVTVTIDSRYPYAQDLTQTRTGIEDGDTATLTNSGSADYLPVFQVNRLNGVTGSGSVPSFTIENITTGIQLEYNDGLPGAIAITGADMDVLWAPAWG
jgi:hypothetical protein